jgi:peptidoglycan/LPS O-acetylase OafA/YrhL
LSLWPQTGRKDAVRRAQQATNVSRGDDRLEPSATGYRTDIDGLRAIAVLPVVAYHISPRLVPGGFIGVDIFFVISGFLITQLLIRDIERGKFSIASFYDRRIRRIFPALLLVLLTTYVLGAIYCLPAEMVDLSKSIVAAVLSVSNFFFWMGSGYFDAPAISKPLVHTWSLAVEEQFYIFWPIFLFLGHRYFKPKLLWAMLAVAAASFALSVAGVFAFPNATFYLPFTRIWELAAGGCLAYGGLPAPLSTFWRNAAGLCGMALIAGSVFLINSDLPFPGPLALPPCAGAFLIILSGRDGQSLVGRLLSLPPLVFVGLISYSLYLWHWPIISFQKDYTFLFSGMSEMMSKLVVIAVSFVAGILSWRFVEQPFRKGPLRPSNRVLRQEALGAVVLILGLAAVAWYSAGFPSRYSPRELEIARYLQYDAVAMFRANRCFFSAPGIEWSFSPECLTLSKTKPNYLLLGDSHAAELHAAFSATFDKINFLQATATGCFPTVVHSLSESRKCSAAIDPIYADFLLHKPIDRVLLVAR